MPVAEGLVDGHALHILRDGLADGQRRGEEPPGLGLARRRGTRGLRLAALLGRAVLSMGLGPLGALAYRARMLLGLGRGHNGGAHDDPARHQGLGRPPASHRRRRPLPLHPPSCYPMLRDVVETRATLTPSLHRRRPLHLVPP
jgi:hypothetical protein